MTKRSQSFVIPLLTLAVSFHSGCALTSNSTSGTISVDLEKAWKKADARNKKGIKYFNDNQPDLAESEFRQAIQINEAHGGAHNNLGLLHYRRRHLAKAATEFEKAIQYMPDNPSAVNNLGMTLEEAGRTHDAIRWYQQAHEMCPTSPLFLGNLLRAKTRAGYRDDLIRDQLRELLMYETRLSWVEWAENQLKLDLDREDAHIESRPDASNSKESTVLIPVVEDSTQLILPDPPPSHPIIEEWKPAPTKPRPLDVTIPPNDSF